MSTFPHKPQATKVTFDADAFTVYLADGRVLSVPLVFFPRLLHASPDQRACYEISGGGSGLHWDELDEDISVEGLLLGVGDRTAPRQPTPSQQSA
jgi:hypothetical protein